MCLVCSPASFLTAGETFCGIAALGLLNRLSASARNNGESKHTVGIDEGFIENVTKWLVSRQTSQLYEDGDEDDDDEDGDEDEDEGKNGLAFTPGFQVQGSQPAVKAETSKPALSKPPSIEPTPEQLLRAGFNGRPNKVADTCYAWWVIGALGVLGRRHLQDFNAAERYLLEKAQHQIGGFSKIPGDPPGEWVSFVLFNCCIRLLLALRRLKGV